LQIGALRVTRARPFADGLAALVDPDAAKVEVERTLHALAQGPW